VDVDPSVDPIEVCARGSLESDSTVDVEGQVSERGRRGSGFRNGWR
jgi:hypothetical protein